jgi:hypothetical protein
VGVPPETDERAVYDRLDKIIAMESSTSDAALGGAPWDAIEARFASARGLAMPSNVVGRPSPRPGALWHLDVLRGSAAGAGGTVSPLRAAYHARWLGHFLAPEEPRYRPSVSVIIPTYNRATLVQDAIDSCLDQTYPAVEVIVVDDGSTDETADVLAGYGARIRVHAQENRGVSAARNAAIAVATGDFVHFLDSDNVLHPDCLARKVAAFAAIPDADLCFSGYLFLGTRGLLLSPQLGQQPTGGPNCPTTDLAAATASGMPLPASTIMVPRWRVMASPQFDEGLSLGEDQRYLFRLARDGAKAIAVSELMLLKRETADSLEARQRRAEPILQEAILRTLVEVLRSPDDWRHLPAVLGSEAIPTSLWHLDFPPEDPAYSAVCRDLLAAVADFGDGARRDALSPLIPLHLLLIAMGRSRQVLVQRRISEGSFHRVLITGLSKAIATAAPLTNDDTSFWETAARPESAGVGALTVMARGLVDKRDAPRLMTDLIRAWGDDPAPRRWATLVRLLPRLGLERSRWIAERIGRAAAPGTAADGILVRGRRLRRAIRLTLRSPSRCLPEPVRRRHKARKRKKFEPEVERRLREAGFKMRSAQSGDRMLTYNS